MLTLVRFGVLTATTIPLDRFWRRPSLLKTLDRDSSLKRVQPASNLYRHLLADTSGEIKRAKAEARERAPGSRENHPRTKASRSLLIVSALTVGMPCGKPG